MRGLGGIIQMAQRLGAGMAPAAALPPPPQSADAPAAAMNPEMWARMGMPLAKKRRLASTLLGQPPAPPLPTLTPPGGA